MKLKRLMFWQRFLPVALAAAVAVGCSDSDDDDSTGGASDGGTVVENETTDTDYEMVWSDGFDVATGLSSAKWNVEVGYGPNGAGWGNDESQLYTDSPDNLKIVQDPGNAANGMLSITARCDSGNCGVRDGSITSAKINTKDKFEFKYGKVEARIKTPDGKSAWPAFWMLGAGYPETSWPHSGEIDIMEQHQAHSDNKTTHATVHWADETKAAGQEWTYFTQYKQFANPVTSDFHVYGLEWDEKQITASIDGETFYTKTIDAAVMGELQKPFYMLLNVAVDGTLGGAPDAIKTAPQEMLVDWVKVFQKPGQTSEIGSGNTTDAETDGESNGGGTEPAANVIALFSDTYTQMNGVDYNPDWGQTTVYTTESLGDGNDIIKLSSFNFQGFDFSANPQDLSAMTTLHLGFRTTNEITADSEFKVKLVDFGANSAFDGGDDSEHELTFNASSTPALVKDSWISFEIPLSDFTGMASKKAVSQLVVSGANGLDTVYLDNIYFSGNGDAGSDTGTDGEAGNGTDTSGSAGSAPAAAAATPAHSTADVTSIFSDAYTNVSDVDYNPGWGQSTVMTGVEIGGNPTLRYTNLNYQGIDFSANVQDLSAMKSLHLDVWTPDEPSSRARRALRLPEGAQLKVKLVDFGADGAFEGGDDTEHELIIDANTTPALTAGGWIGYDISLSDFSGLTNKTAVAQIVISGTNGLATLYLDNIYFHNGEGTTTFGTSAAADDGVHYLYASDTNANPLDLIPDTDFIYSEWGSGSQLDGGFTGDATYSPVFQVRSGSGWGAPAAVLGFSSLEKGFAEKYSCLTFKLKGGPSNQLTVNFASDGYHASEARFYGSNWADLGDGWRDVSIPLAAFPNRSLYTGFAVHTGYGNGGTLLLTDIAFTDADCVRGGNGEIVSGVGAPPPPAPNYDDGVTYFYSSNTFTMPWDLVPDTDYGFSDWGSGSAFNGDYTADTTYSPVFQVKSGTGWGAHNAVVAFNQLTAGFAQNHSCLAFKVKNLPTDDIRVKFASGGAPEREVSFSVSGNSSDLAGGWKAVSLPLSSFPDIASYTEFALLAAAGTEADFLLTDIGLLEDGTTCPAAPVAPTLTLTVSVSGTPGSVGITGPWWGWGAGPVATDNGDGTWTVTMDPIPTADMEYLWVVDGVQENLVDNSPQNFNCTPVTDWWSYANRQWSVGSGNVTDTYDSCS